MGISHGMLLQDNSTMGIRATIGELNALLQQHDHELWSHLENSKVCCFCTAASQLVLITACKRYSSTMSFIHTPRPDYAQGLLPSSLLHLPQRHHHVISGRHSPAINVLYPHCLAVAQ